MILVWLKANWNWVWRVALAVIVVAFLWYMIGIVMQWKADADALPLVKARAAEELALERAHSQLMHDQFDIAYEASTRYQRELEELRNAPREPAPVIRVCKPAPAVRSRPTGAAAPGSDAAAPATGGVQETVEFDTQPLYDIADQCDRLSAQVRGLQTYETERTKP